MRLAHATAAALLALTLTACGGSEEKKADPEPSASAVPSVDPNLESSVAYLNANAAFESEYSTARAKLLAAAQMNDGPAMLADLQTMRKALFDFDATVREIDLDRVAEQRNTLLTEIGEQIAIFDQMTTATDAATVTAATKPLFDQEAVVADARIALTAAVG